MKMQHTAHGYTISLGGRGAVFNTQAKIREIAAKMRVPIPANFMRGKGMNATVADEVVADIKRKVLDTRKDWRGFKLTDDILQQMQDSDRPWRTLLGKKTDEQRQEIAAAAAAHTTKHTIGMPSYGLSGYDMEDAIKSAREAKQEWKFNCISFEVWAAMTGYESLPDGGEAFQKMCHYLLVDGRSSKNTDLVKKGYFNDDNGEMSGDNWGEVDPIEDTWWDASMKGGADYAYIGERAAVWQRGKGGPIGYNSQDDSNLGGAGFDKQQKAGIEMPVSIRPGSKGNWMHALGISMGEMRQHGTHAMQFTNGVRSLPRETEGSSMSKANTLAAIIGLYFYPNCMAPDLNWTMGGTVEGKAYHVRMRLPNPNYIRGAQGSLSVVEENNPSSQERLQIPSTTIGGDGGFSVRSMFKFRNAPLLHINLFLFPSGDTNLLTIIAPFFGDEYSGWQSTKAKRDREYISELIRKNPDLAPMMHTPEANAGLVLGWKMSAALWLYPHVNLESWTEVQTDMSKLPGWQPTPRWRVQGSNYTSVADIFQEYADFGNLLRKDKNYSYTNEEIKYLRRYALGKDQPALSNPSQMSVNFGAASSSNDPPQPRDNNTADEGEDQQETPMQVEQDIDLQTDRDDVTGSGGQAEILQQDQNNTSMQFGDRSIGVADVVQNLAFAGELPESGIAADVDAAGGNVAVRDVFSDNPTEPGAAMVLDRDINEHFTSVQAQPWPHTDIYELSKHKFNTAPLDANKRKDYADKYGDVTNMYMEGTQANEITGVEVRFGFAKAGVAHDSILLDKITTDSPVHRKNLRRILLIYYHNSSIGFTDKKGRNKVEISAKDKKEGMLKGIYRAKVQGPQTYTYPRSGTAHRGSGTYMTTRAGRLWPPVFKEEPPEDWAECFDFNLHQGFDKDLMSCMDNNNDYDLNQIESDMTVLEWITSPWHYAYLPYQPQKALFRDGETYSEGCRRCSRPFYEYDNEYSAYKYSVKGTEHWPSSYWQYDDNQCAKGAGNKEGKAPQPFHDTKFWLAATKKPKFAATLREVERGDASTPPLDTEDADKFTYQGWPTHEFQMPKCEMGYRKLDNVRGLPKLSRLHKALKSNGEPATFRKYINHVYDQDRKEHQERAIVQGKLTWTTAKVKYGHTDYKLRRVSKYCNVCNDCASVLELAGGLFLRNYRVVKHASVVMGNDREVNTSMDWWVNVLHKSGNNAVDPADLHRRGAPQDQDAWDRTLASVSTYLRDTQHSLPDTRTKMDRPPEINVQNTIDNRNDKRNKDMAKATLQKLVQRHDSTRQELGGARPNRPDITEEEFKNPVFRRVMADMARNMARNDAFEVADQTQVFDANTMRKEYRNEVWMVDGEEWTNCLRIRSWKPKNGVRQEPTMVDYETTIYLASRYGPNGKASSGGSLTINIEGTTGEYPITVEGVIENRPRKYGAKRVSDKSQWAGDGFITDAVRSSNGTVRQDAVWKNRDPLPRPCIQTRTLRQSRLFITYSLHRPVTSEMEARLVMERMANAAHLVFGDDRYVSRLLVFGQKLINFQRDKTKPPDSISAAHFTLIDKPRKKEAINTFYAKATGSSYVYDTYETHVDKVEVDGGIEIGPTMKHPHFHILVTISHYTYIQIDYFKMNQYFELLFRGHDPFFNFPDNYVKNNFELIDASGGPFYTDNEHPYVDIRLYPQDNWQEVLAAYVRKQSRSILGAIDIRAGRTRRGNRPNDYNRSNQ